jgi:hypothetical protein
MWVSAPFVSQVMESSARRANDVVDHVSPGPHRSVNATRVRRDVAHQRGCDRLRAHLIKGFIYQTRQVIVVMKARGDQHLPDPSVLQVALRQTGLGPGAYLRHQQLSRRLDAQTNASSNSGGRGQ